MIAQLVGNVVRRTNNVLVIDVNGVGYEVHCSSSVLQQALVGQQHSLVIYTDVREDCIKLFGFIDQTERQVFSLLRKVKGVGSKTAADIISQVDKLELLRIIGSGDSSRLQGVRGIGKKTAERLVLELKEKVAEFILEGRESSLGADLEVLSNDAIYSEARAALKSLGFSSYDSERALDLVRAKLPSSDLDSATLIKEALRHV